MRIKRFLYLLILLIPALAPGAGAQQPSGTAAGKKPGVTPDGGARQRARETAGNRAASRRAAGSITGRVVAEGGQPLAGVSVSAVVAGEAKVEPRSTGTNQDGKFRLDDLAPGAYRVIVNAPGYVTASEASQGRREWPYYRPGDSVSITMMKGGVITGTVVNSNGEPVVGLAIEATRVRDANGRHVRGTNRAAYRWTDDRGIYRVYGLEPGSYIVAASTRRTFYGMTTNDGETPTYYPSATRDTATEVTVGGGQEVSAIDIRYRGEQGHTVSGTFSGGSGRAGPVTSYLMIVLSHASSGAVETMTYVPAWEHPRAFALEAVPDGDYYLAAQGGTDEERLASLPRRVTVGGADVTGLELSLVPLGSIAGRIVLETARDRLERKAECQTRRSPFVPEETVIKARRDEAGTRKEVLPPLFTTLADSTPDAQGNFQLKGLVAGRYHVLTWLPVEDWYVRAVTLPAATAAPGGQFVDAARDAVTLRSNERLQGVSIILAEGAAGLRGRVAGAGDGARGLAAPLTVHLVPAERENADAILRFAEAVVLDDGTFAFGNIAPGRYWLIARPAAVSDAAAAETTPRPVAWDGEARARLRREAEAANVVIDLQPCQLIIDYVLRAVTGDK